MESRGTGVLARSKERSPRFRKCYSVDILSGLTPRAFVSHAGEDTEFAEAFAEALRSNGVDAWLDKWETRAGDSLPQKVFGALDEAKFVVAVLSPHSVRKPWVTAELDLAVVKRIEGETRIIPVSLGIAREEIPAALRAIKWVSVPDPGNFQAALDEVLDAIFQRSRKPPLGASPGFTEVAIPDLPNLAHSDVVVLKALFNFATEGDYFSISPETPKQRTAGLGISQQAFVDGLEVLRSEGYVSFQRLIGGGIAVVELTRFAVEECCKAWIPGYDERVRRILSEIVNRPEGSGPQNKSLAEELGEPFWLITHVFDSLADRGLVKTSQAFVGYRRLLVWWVSPQLKRQLRT